MAFTTPGTAVAGEVLTAAFWNEQVRDNSDALHKSVRRIGYQTRTTSYTVSATTVAGAADIFSSDITWTADGTSSYEIELYIPQVETATGANAFVYLALVDGSGNDLGRFGFVGYADGTRAAVQIVNARYQYTPASGSRSINVRAFYGNAGNGLLSAGAGGSGNIVPMFLAVYGARLT